MQVSWLSHHLVAEQRADPLVHPHAAADTPLTQRPLYHARALVSVLSHAGHVRTPEAAVDVLLNTVSKFRDGTAVNNAKGTPRSIRTAAPEDAERSGRARP